VEIAFDAEFILAVWTFDFAMAHKPKFGTAVAGVAEAVGALRILGVDLSEEPAGVPVRREQLDDGYRVEVESGASCVAGGATIGEEFGVLSFGDDVQSGPQRSNLVGPTERRTRDGSAGPQRSRMRSVSGQSRASDSQSPGEGTKPEQPGQTEERWRGRCNPGSIRRRCTGRPFPGGLISDWYPLLIEKISGC
jgi:hypothetical protein